MGNWIAALVGVVVTGVVIYIIATLNLQSQERSISAVQQRAVRTSEMNLVAMVESDFQNIGSNFPAFDNDPEFAITHYDTASSKKVFQFTGQTVRWAAPDVVRYEWSVLGSKQIKRDGALVNVDVYQVKRFVNDVLSGSSTGLITRFEIGLRKSDGSPVAGVADTRQVVVGISMASSLGSSALLGETHWDTIIRPAAMARWDYLDYIRGLIMGAYAYIFVAGFVIIGGLTAMAMRSDNRDANEELYGVQFKEEARDAAVTGMNLTIRRIVDDEGQWVNPADYQIAETAYRKALYETTVTTYGLGDTVDVTSVGTKGFLNKLGVSDDTTHTIDVRIIRANLAGGVPPGFEVAILTDGDMRIQGTFEVRALDPSQNADIHANGTLETRGNSFLVEGYGSYTSGSRIRNGDNFQPNYDWNGSAQDVVYQDSIPIPAIDIAAFKSDSQYEGVYNAGDVDIDQAYLNSLAGGSITSFGDLASGLGYGSSGVGTTAENPFIFFSEGTIGFIGDVKLDGYGAFVSAGDLRINSNVHIIGELGESFFGHPTTQMGIFTAGDADINGGAVIQATLYIDGAVKFNGDATITGGAIMRSISKMLGSFTLIWVGPNEGLVKYFGGWRTVLGPVIAAWAEW